MAVSDKEKHAIVGAILSMIGLMILDCPAGFILPISFAVGKEIWDKFSKGHVEIEDIIATLFGAGVGWGIWHFCSWWKDFLF